MVSTNFYDNNKFVWFFLCLHKMLATKFSLDSSPSFDDDRWCLNDEIYGEHISFEQNFL